MDVKATDDVSDPSSQPRSSANAARMVVICNSQIIASVMRSALVISLLAFIVELLAREIPSGPFREVATSFGVALLAVAIGLFILDHFLDRALRRCPVCLTRITSATEEKRRCLECDTPLWDSWDE